MGKMHAVPPMPLCLYLRQDEAAQAAILQLIYSTQHFSNYYPDSLFLIHLSQSSVNIKTAIENDSLALPIRLKNIYNQ